MKDDSFSLEGKNIKEIVDYADNLFRGDDNKKIEAHKIYKQVLEKIPNLQDGEKSYVVRGIIRKRICSGLYSRNWFFSGYTRWLCQWNWRKTFSL